MKIYVASSWRNELQPYVVDLLKKEHEVYDFRNPAPGNNGFAWSQIDRDWQNWSLDGFRNALKHPIAQEGFRLDMDALRWCDACVLVLPCGRSAHLELGWAAGAGKKTMALAYSKTEPELMYLMLDAVCVDFEEMLSVIRIWNIRSCRWCGDQIGQNSMICAACADERGP